MKAGRKRRLRFTLTVGAAGFTCIANAQPVLVDPALEAVPHASGFSQPVGMAFLGTNDAFVVEKASGRVIHVVNGLPVGTVLDLAVNSASERGLLSITLDPGFAKNGRVYLFWSESSTGADTTAVAEIALMGNRVDRFVWNGSVLVFDRNILQLRAFQADAGQPGRGNHDGGVTRFGPDGKLYVITGDTGRRGYLQNNLQGPVPDDQFGGPEPDAAHLTGVIFRVNPDGSAPGDNPFFGRTAFPTMDKVFGYGVRNGFGMAFDPATGLLWTQENGDDTFDEMNLVQAGFNGGWIQFMGPLSRIQQYREIEIARPGGLQQIRWPPTNIATHYITGYKRLWHARGSKYADPKFSWKFAVAPASMNFVHSNGLGSQYQGDLIVGASRPTLQNGYLFRFEMNAARDGFAFTDPRLNDLVADNLDKFDITESESLQFGSGFGVVTCIENSPDGRFFACSLDQGTIWEIRRR